MITLSVLTGVLLVALGGMYVAARRTHDSDNPRRRANGYLMTHTVTVARSPDEVFDFITYRMKDHNLALATAHESFAFRHGDALTPGAVFVTEEFIGNDGVRNEYVVREVVPNRLMYMASTPSQILRRTDDSVERVATCNAYVYFDLDETPVGTRLTQTLVIEMPNFVVKFLADLAAARADENPSAPSGRGTWRRSRPRSSVSRRPDGGRHALGRGRSITRRETRPHVAGPVSGWRDRCGPVRAPRGRHPHDDGTRGTSAPSRSSHFWPGWC